MYCWKGGYDCGGEDVDVLSNGLGLHEHHRAGKQVLRRLGAAVRGFGSRKTVRVQRLPALCTFELHPVEPQGLLGHVLDVNLEEYFLAFDGVEEGGGGFRGMDFGLDRQWIGDLADRHEIPILVLYPHTKQRKK